MSDIEDAQVRPPTTGRIAIFCTECRQRGFDPNWRCPAHPGKCVVQKNHPYFGQEVPTVDIPGLKQVGADEVLKAKK